MTNARVGVVSVGADIIAMDAGASRRDGMRVAITGGTGSLGQALTKKWLLDSAVSRIVVLSRDEVKQARMAEGVSDPKDKLRFFLGDVRDRARLEQAFSGCDTVIHAAALKRVDAVAYSPSEARKTNVEGSANVVAAAVATKIRRVLMISSDKAVQPTNFYGVTKQMMEQEAVASNAWTCPQGTMVSCTRWGNVAGSRGSVVHVFRRALQANQPLPLTDERCTRFWLTLDDAVGYVDRALERMEGGEVFVPSGLMRVRLEDLAQAVQGPDYGHQRVIVGLRPGGEKLHEALVTPEELARTHEGARFLTVVPAIHSWRTRGWDGWLTGRVLYDSSQGPFLSIEALRDQLPLIPEEPV